MIKSLLLSALLMAPVAAAIDYPVHRETSATRTLRFGGTGVHTLDVRMMSGAIHVSGYDGADVQVEMRRRVSAESDEAAQAADRDVTLDATDGAPTIEAVVRDADRTTCGERTTGRSPAWWDRRRYEVKVDLTIRVPRSTRLRLCTVNGGDIHVEDISGDFDIDNVNGGITLDRMGGAGRAATVNGRVVASFARAPRAESLFKTVNGDIVVTLPPDTSADLRLKTFNGGLFTDFDTVARASKAEPAGVPGNGKFVYRTRGFTSVQIGRGGPELTVDTLNGDVRIVRAR